MSPLPALSLYNELLVLDAEPLASHQEERCVEHEGITVLRLNIVHQHHPRHWRDPIRHPSHARMVSRERHHL
ncbi:hypothetical protein ACGFYQ_35060 [Streptomyces sp. NPDC048258]|uniref:hypothetical protein n=1 Tax=Streptomyces sp. NPDC048258 TaxID=3365527 RepID=UPI003714A23E